MHRPDVTQFKMFRQLKEHGEDFAKAIILQYLDAFEDYILEANKSMVNTGELVKDMAFADEDHIIFYGEGRKVLFKVNAPC